MSEDTPVLNLDGMTVEELDAYIKEVEEAGKKKLRYLRAFLKAKKEAA